MAKISSDYGLLRFAPRALLLVACMWGSWQSISADEQVWTIVPSGSDVRIHVGKSGLFGAAGHTHEVMAPAVSGKVRLDPERIDQAAIEIIFNAAAFKVSETGEPPDDAPKVQQMMLSDKVLDVMKYPTIVFRSRQISIESRSGERLRLRVVGDLTLHGVTRSIEGPVSVAMSADRLSGTGTVIVKQTSFGIKPVSAGLGTVKVKDDVAVSYAFTARR